MMDPLGHKSGVQRPADQNDSSPQDARVQSETSSPKLKGAPEKASPDTQIAEREIGIASTVAGYIGRGVGFIRHVLFPGRDAPEREKNHGNGAAPVLDRLAKSQYEMELEIYDAGKSLTTGEALIDGPPVPPLKQAMESTEKAQKYVKESESRELDLNGLLEKVKNQKSKKDKEKFFRSIFLAKSLEEWKEFAVLQMIDPDEFGIHCKQKFMELAHLHSPDKSAENTEQFRQKSLSFVVGQINAQLKGAPEERISQLRGLAFLVKQFSALEPEMDTSGLTDNLDKLVAQQPTEDMLQLETLPKMLKDKLIEE